MRAIIFQAIRYGTCRYCDRWDYHEPGAVVIAIDPDSAVRCLETNGIAFDALEELGAVDIRGPLPCYFPYKP